MTPESLPLTSALLLRAMGAWLPVAWMGDVSEEPAERSVVHTSMSGAVSVTVLGRGRRTWKVSGDSPMDFGAALQRICAGTFGIGPFEMISPIVARTNMVTPGGDIGGSSSAGVATIDGAPYPVRISPTATARFPVVPGVPLQARAIIGGLGASMRLSWYDDTDSLIGSATAAGAGFSAWTVTTGTPPSNAMWARVVPIGSTTGGAAQVRTVAHSDGRYYAPSGVQSVYVQPGGSSWSRFGDTATKTTATASVTIYEVAP